MGMVVFDDRTATKLIRSFSPVLNKSVSHNYFETNNNFQDHRWDGFYTSQLKLNRFPLIVQ